MDEVIKRKSTYFIILLTLVIQGCIADSFTPKLIIRPTPNANLNQVQTAIGQQSVITCEPDVAVHELITDFKWYFGGEEIDPNPQQKYGNNYPEIETGDGRSSLIFRQVREEDRGKYTCKARYSSQELSTDVILWPYEMIQVVNAPRDQYATLGETYMVRCEVTANPSPVISWVRDGQRINMSMGRYAQDTKGLVIQEVTKADEGVYTCRATVIESGQRVENVIVLQVIQKPEITFITPGVEGTESEGVIMECKTAGTLPEIDWTLRGMILSQKERFTVDKITGRLQIDGLRVEDTGDYQCRANNSAGEDVKTTQLIVYSKPVIEDIVNRTSPVHNETTITCRAKGHPLPDLYFQKDGNDNPFNMGLQDNQRISQEKSIDERNNVAQVDLKIRELKRTDDGLYKCVASNKRIKVERMGHITVEYPPVFNNKTFQDFFTYDRFPVNLTCIVESIPNATVTWYRSGQINFKVIEDQDYRIFNFPFGSYLQVTPNRDDLYGPYACEVRNYLGSDQGSMQLRKAEPPGRLQSVRLEKQTATTLTFQFAGPAYNGGLDVDDIRVYYWLESEPPEKSNMKGTSPHDRTITIEGLEPVRSYKFRFVAHNRVGEGERYEVVQTTGKVAAPEPPVIITEVINGVAISEFPDKIKLQWRTPENNGERIEGYELTYIPVRNTSFGKWEPYDNIDIEVKLLNDDDMLEYSLVNLQPNTFYKVEVRAQNRLGWSNPGILIVKTSEQDYTSSQKMKSSGSTVLANNKMYIIIGAVLSAILIIVFVDLACCRIKKKGIFYCIFNGTSSRATQNGSAMTKGSANTQEYEQITPGDEIEGGEPHKSLETDVDSFHTVPLQQVISQPLISDSNGHSNSGKLYGGSQASAHTLV